MPLLPVKKKEVILHDFTSFYIIFCNFINWLVFIDIKQTLYYKVALTLLYLFIKYFYFLYIMFVSHIFTG